MSCSLSRLDLTGTGYCASFNFRRASRAVTRLYDAALQPSGLRSTQFTILIAIAKSQPVSVGDLGRILLIDDTTLTRSLRLLAADKLIARSERGAMRRRFLTVTPRGEHALAEALPRWRRIQAEFQAKIGAQHWIDLRAELERLAHLAASLEENSSERPAAPRVAARRAS